MYHAGILVAFALAFGLPMVTTASDSGFNQLLADIEDLRSGYGVAGFALTVVSGRRGTLTAVGGLADIETGRPVDRETMFRIGSITKTFNALAIMMLVEQERLQLDTPVRKIAADITIENPWADTDPLRVGQLLEHSSGLLDLTREEFDRNVPFPTLEAAFAWRPHARAVQWRPGLHSVYSNANAGLAGLVIERVSGQDYARFITERLLRPLGMETAGLFEDDDTRKRLATGYDTDGKTPIPYWHMIFPPLGAINVTPGEMAALLELFIGRGEVGGRRLLEARSIESMERPTTTLAARHGMTFGYGPGLDQWVHDGFLWYGHGGDGDGYLSRFGYNRDADAAYFLTINAFKQDALNAMRDLVQAYLTRQTPVPRPASARIDADAMQALTGTYVSATRRFHWQSPESQTQDRLQIVLEDGDLYTRSGDGRRLLIPVDEHLFRRQGEPVATIAIVEQDGDWYLQADFGNYKRVDDEP